MITHVMLDLETWGIYPGSDIRSIGACVFDPMVGVSDRTFYQAVRNPVVNTVYDFMTDTTRTEYKFALHRNSSTEKWWQDQSDEAKAAFADWAWIDDGLWLFTEWLRSLCDPTDLRIWSHGSHFDVPIMAQAYLICGLEIPWHYRSPRDTRTILEAVGIDPVSGMDMFSTGVAHHALDDAITQAKAVCAAYKVLKGMHHGSSQ